MSPSRPLLVGLVLSCLCACRAQVDAGAQAFEHGIDLPAPLSASADAGITLFDGDFDSDERALSELDGVQLITGDLRLSALNDAELVQFDLEQVNGDVIISGSDALRLINLGQLRRVGGALRITQNSALTSVNLARLLTTGGEVALRYNAALNFINLSGLSRAGGLQLATDALRSFSAPALNVVEGDLAVGAEVFASNDALASVQLDTLSAVGGNLRVVQNPALRAFSAPALTRVGETLVVAQNPLLDTVELDALAHVGEAFCLCDNPLLPQCAADAVQASLQSPPAQSVATGNNPSGVCQ